VLIIFWHNVFAQEQADSIQRLDEVVITLSGTRSALRTTNTERKLGEREMKNQSPNSLVSLVNTVAGVRMEERSPGSYRLSMRGSLLRSPFGIRNVKIYIDEFPLTDAGGNTYLNLIDAAGIRSMEIYKGPQASVLGANTGGAISIGTSSFNKSYGEFGLLAGSYGLLHQTANIVQLLKKYEFSVNEGYQQSDGYRENSALKRKYIQTTHRWHYNEKGTLKLFLFYSNLQYETPGGLTAAQMLADPKAARPSTPTLPGAVQQQAGIFNETIYGGLSNNYQFNANFHWVTALFGNHTNYQNPFITNYEKRKEHTIGWRSFINYQNYKNQFRHFDVYLGAESSITATNIDNFGNSNGAATTMQASDDLMARQTFGFLKVNLDLNRKLMLELGTSLNFFGYSYESYFPVAIAKQERNFKAQLMPKIAASYLIAPTFSVRSAVSKGYSPPTIAEVRASDQQVNTDLQAEAGWNYEAGLHFEGLNNRFSADGCIFNFNLDQTIVRRLTAADLEYFVNAGSTRQLGTEFEVSYQVLQPKNTRFLNAINVSSSFTYSHFRFAALHTALTGVPKHTIVSGLEFIFAKGIYLFGQHNYTAEIPLNDANSVYSKKYHLADLKMGIRNLELGKSKLNLFFGINNVFNEAYSLGNDLNAANGRYYNPAAGANYYTGLSVSLGR
jgi:iron complex outermembrane receptor protein